MADRGATLMLIRHGLTDWNESGRLMGRTDGIGLNARGRAQAAALGDALRHLRPDLLLASPRRRTQETAAAIAEACGRPVETDDALDEVWLGRWQGKTFGDIADDPDLRHWLADPTWTCEAIEPLDRVQARVLPVLERVRALPPGALAIVVSHGDPLRVLLAHVLGLALGDYRRLDVRPGSVAVVRLAPESGRLLVLGWRPGAALPGIEP